jgi:hypothetical protein
MATIIEMIEVEAARGPCSWVVGCDTFDVVKRIDLRKLGHTIRSKYLES